MRNNPDHPVCVLVDAVDPNGRLAGRRNYWRYVSAALKRGRKFQEFAIREMPADNCVFNFDQFETVILNTDLANGDAVFGSDMSWMFFARQGRVRMDAWFRNGMHPRLIVEHQGLRLIPSQSAYDAILGQGEVKVPSFEPWFTALAGGTSLVVHQFRDHPALVGLEGASTVAACDRGGRVRPFFGAPQPSWLGTEESPTTGSVFEVRNDSLYGGWFEEWDSEWVPVLRAPSSARSDSGDLRDRSLAPPNNATMLVKIVSEDDYRQHRIPDPYARKGVIIATTLRLAAKAPDELLSGILNSEYATLVDYHRRAVNMHKRNTAIAAAVLITSFALVSTTIGLVWDQFIITSDNRWVRLFSEALGLPLFIIMFAHWRAYRSFASRGMYAGPRWRIPLYWLSRFLMRPKKISQA